MRNIRIVLVITITSFLFGCPWDDPSEDENPLQALGGPFSEKASVETDLNGNFMAVWKDGVSIWSKHYPQGVGQTPFRVELGDSPEIDMDPNGNVYLAYHREVPNNRNVANTFLKKFDAATSSWQIENAFVDRQSLIHNYSPDIAVYDDLVHITARSSTSPSPVVASRLMTAHLATDGASTIKFRTSPLGPELNHLPTHRSLVAAGANQRAMMVFAMHELRGLRISHFGYNNQIPSRSTWTYNQPQDVLTDLKVRPGNYRIAMSGNGDTIVAWISEHSSGTSPNASTLSAAYFSTITNEWTSQTIGSQFVRDNADFDLSMDDQGNAFLLYDNQSTGLTRVSYDQATATWSSHTNVFRAGNYTSIKLDQTRSGNTGLVFSIDNEIYLSRYRWDSGQWSNLEFIGEGVEADIAVDDKNECIAVWLNEGFLFEYQCSNLPLEVSITNDEGGKVVSTPVAIDCGFLLGQETTKCLARFQPEQEVTLVPTADSNFAFDSWGDDCAGLTLGTEPDSVVVTMDTAKTCSATFSSTAITEATLTVSKFGTGDGVISSDIGGIDCGTTCGVAYTLGETVTLTAVANSDSDFTGWSGTGNCSPPDSIVDNAVTVTLTQNSDCQASFNTKSFVLTVSKIGSGDGMVVSDITAIDCGADCDASLDINTQVILTGTPDANSTFSNWSGTGDCQSPTILVDGSASITVSQDSECIATFDPVSSGDFILTVIINGGPHAGSVNSTETPAPTMQCLNSGNEDPSSTCTANYAVDSSVTLVASIFFPNNTLNVTGCDSFVGANFDCFVTMTQNKTVTFNVSESPEFDISATVTGSGSIISFALGDEVGVTGRIECPSVNCNDTFVVPTGAPTRITFEAHPDTGSTFVSWGAGQCDSEQLIGEVGICNVDLIPGSPTTRQVDATFQ